MPSSEKYPTALIEDMLRVSHRTPEVFALQREHPHTRGLIRSWLRLFLKSVCFPFLNRSHNSIPPQRLRPKLLHDPYNPRTNFRTSNANAAPSTEQPKSHRKKWCVIPAYDSSIISNVIRVKIRW